MEDDFRYVLTSGDVVSHQQQNSHFAFGLMRFQDVTWLPVSRLRCQLVSSKTGITYTCVNTSQSHTWCMHKSSSLMSTIYIYTYNFNHMDNKHPRFTRVWSSFLAGKHPYVSWGTNSWSLSFNHPTDLLASPCNLGPAVGDHPCDWWWNSGSP